MNSTIVVEGMNRAVSSFRSHIGQTGNATVQIFPPEEKKVVSSCNSLELHLRHLSREDFADSLLNRCSTAARRIGVACMSYDTPEPKMRLFDIAHFCAVAGRQANLMSFKIAPWLRCGTMKNR